MIVPLHNHSEYSALDGLSTVREIAERCVECGCPACALTDHGTVAGHLEFSNVLNEYGVKPIFGCELYHGVKATPQKNERDQAHFVVGARTDEGLRNLWRLVDSAANNFYFVGRVTWEGLEKYREGVFATSACIAGLVSQGIKSGDLSALDRYANIYKDNFYIELHTYPTPEQQAVNLALVQIAQERGLPLVYATDAHFARRDQYQYHDAYVAMQVKDNIDLPPDERKMWHPPALYIMDEDEIRSEFSYLPQWAVDDAINNSVAIAETCNAQLPEVKRHLPMFVPRDCPWLNDETRSPGTLLLDLVEEGLHNRYGEDLPKEVTDRAAMELEVFLNTGLEHYFLQTWDFCKFCDANGIERGPGRGSAGGAIVAYALGVTDIDPLAHGLFFERFYNAGREKGFPDIDSDFPVASRKVVRDYLIQRWGQDKVKTIGTITRMKPKAACDKTYGVCGVTWGEKEAVKKLIDKVPDIDILGPDSIGWSQASDPGKTIYVMDHVGYEIVRWVEDQPEDRQEVLARWLDILDTLCSRISGYGIHPSGVVVSDVALADELPCDLRGPKGAKKEDRVPATQFPMSDVDVRQFVKQDLLGLRNLDTLADWKKQAAWDGEWSGLEWHEHPEEMWELLDRGLSLGIFQIEDGYASKLCKEFKPRSVEDLSIIVALNRPGPIRSGAPHSFIRRRRGEEPVTYDHPMLEEILEPTYGWFLYQEQVIEYFNRLGYSLSESDAVRKILGKKKPEDMKKLRDGEGEWKGKGYYDFTARFMDRVTAETIWLKLEDFAKYSFNKSHSVAYATLALRTLYAKYTAPAEFIMACIRTNPDDAGDYVLEGRRLGVEVSAPDIVKSQTEITVVDGTIYFGFLNVKGIGKGSANYLCEVRDRFNVRTPEQLDNALSVLQADWEAERDRRKLNGQRYLKKSPRSSFKANQMTALINAGAFDYYVPRSLTMKERQKFEKELLGVIITDDVAEVMAANHDVIVECDSYEFEDGNGRYRLAGVITAIRETKTSNGGKPMGIVKFGWEGDEVEFAVFPNQWKAYKFLWNERTPGVFTINKTERGYNFEEGIKLG